MQMLEDNVRGINQIVRDLDRKYSILTESLRFEKAISVDRMESYSEPDSATFFNKTTYSQSGEDAIVLYYLLMTGTDITRCKYLDLGANHPQIMSNTYSLYERGGCGVLVDANKDLVAELKKERPRDLVLHRCVDLLDGEKVKFYLLSGDGLSTTDYSHVQSVIATNPEVSLSGTEEVETITVNTLLKKYFLDGIDVMNVDIEGKDDEIIKSIDFETFRPKVIITEMIPYSTKVVMNKKNEAIINYMKSNDYAEYAFTGINSIFVDSRVALRLDMENTNGDRK